MRLIFPTLEYKEKAMEYINEFYEYDSKINGVGALNWFLKESTYEALKVYRNTLLNERSNYYEI